MHFVQAIAGSSCPCNIFRRVQREISKIFQTSITGTSEIKWTDTANGVRLPNQNQFVPYQI